MSLLQSENGIKHPMKLVFIFLKEYKHKIIDCRSYFYSVKYTPFGCVEGVAELGPGWSSGSW